MADLEKKVKQIICEQLGVHDIKLSDHIVEDLEADSLDQVQLVMELEDFYDLSISDEEAEKLTTVGSIIEAVKHKMT